MNMCLPWSSVCSSPPPRPRRWRSDPHCFLSFSDRPEEIYTETDHVFELLMDVQLKADHERGEAALEAIFDKKVAAEIAEGLVAREMLRQMQENLPLTFYNKYQSNPKKAVLRL